MQLPSADTAKILYRQASPSKYKSSAEQVSDILKKYPLSPGAVLTSQQKQQRDDSSNTSDPGHRSNKVRPKQLRLDTSKLHGASQKLKSVEVMLLSARKHWFLIAFRNLTVQLRKSR